MTDDLKEFSEMDSDRDIVGLWKEKPEPFDLEKALQGEPVKLRNGNTAYVITNYQTVANNLGIKSPMDYYPLSGIEVIHGDFTQVVNWALDGMCGIGDLAHPQDIIGMVEGYVWSI